MGRILFILLILSTLIACSAHDPLIASLGWGYGHSPVVGGKAPATILLPSTSALSNGGTDDEVNFGDWTQLDGTAHFSCVWEYRTSGTSCTGGGNLNFWARNVSSNRQVQVGCSLNDLNYGVAATASSMLTKSTTSDIIPAVSINVRQYYVYDGTIGTDEDRVTGFITSEYHGRIQLTLSDSGGAVPAVLTTVATNTLFGPASGTPTLDYADQMACWFDYTLAARDRCFLDGGTWVSASSTCNGSPTYPGEMRDPRSTDVDCSDGVCLTEPADFFVTFGERGDTTALIANRANPGTYNGTPTDGTATFIAASNTNRMRGVSVFNRFTNYQDTNVEQSSPVMRRFRTSRGWDAQSSANSRTYFMQPKLYQVGFPRVRLQWNGGATHGDDTMFGRESLSFSQGKWWPISGSVDWGFSTDVELYRSQTETNRTIGGNGDRGFAWTCIPTRDSSQQGVCLLHWNSVDAVGPDERDILAERIVAGDWYSNQPALVDIATPFYQSEGTRFESQAAFHMVSLFNGALLHHIYAGDTSDPEYRTLSRRAAPGDSKIDPTLYDEEFSLEDGDTTTPPTIPEEPTGFMIKGGPNHGRVLVCVRTDAPSPGGFQSGECACTWTDNPEGSITYTDRTPGGGDPNSSILDWSSPEAFRCGNTPTIAMEDDGTIVIVNHANPSGGSVADGEMYVNVSQDWGGTFSQPAQLTAGNEALLRLNNIAGPWQHRQNRMTTAWSYELQENENFSTGLVDELNPDLTAGGPMPAWANSGSLRLNDGGAVNESVILGDVPSLDGGPSGVRDRTTATIDGWVWLPNAAVTRTVLDHWGATDGAQSFLLEILSDETLQFTLSNGASDCVLTSGVGAVLLDDGDGTPEDAEWNHFAFTKAGTTVALYLNGASVDSTCNSGSVPADWASNSGSELRIGMSYLGTLQCTDCRIDELAITNGYAASSAQISAAYNSSNPLDPRAREWTAVIDGEIVYATPGHYWPLEGGNGSDLFDALASMSRTDAFKVLDYGYNYAQLWGDPQNLEEADFVTQIP